jgi:hypothetical protein
VYHTYFNFRIQCTLQDVAPTPVKCITDRTDCVEHNPPWESYSNIASLKFSFFYGTRKYVTVCRRACLVLCHINPVHILILCCHKSHFNIILTPTLQFPEWSLSLKLSSHNFVIICHFPFACHTRIILIFYIMLWDSRNVSWYVYWRSYHYSYWLLFVPYYMFRPVWVIFRCCILIV